ncbi:MAG: DinB family protein [Dehalococcoidia bacterium]
MDGLHVIKTLIVRMHESFLDVMENVDQEVADWLPTGEAHPIRTSAAHILWVEDAFVNAVIRESTTVWADLGLQEKTGIRPGPIPNLEWAQTTKIDIEELKKVYVNELFENTEAYIGNLDPKDLNRDIDIEGKGRALKRVLIGTRVSDILLTLSIHSANHIGEIASQKGTQGLQGYSF